MSSNIRPQAFSTSAADSASERSYFESQRAALLSEIEKSFEAVLANINKLNRSLEGVIAVGNEFSSVEALWSQFETVRAKDPDAEIEEVTEGGQSEGDEGEGEAGDTSEEDVSRR